MKKTKDKNFESDLIAKKFCDMGEEIEKTKIDVGYSLYVILNLTIYNLRKYVDRETIEEIVAAALEGVDTHTGSSEKPIQSKVNKPH